MKELRIYGEEKAAVITIETGISPRIEANDQGFFVYLYPDTTETKKALQAFFDNVEVPAKDYSSLCKSFRAQMLSLKNQSAKNGRRND